METVVYQSYRTHDVPVWIERCLSTVRAWASLQGFDYRFIDDRLFDYVSAWYRQKVSSNVLLMSDLARLVVARELLREGYRRTIWLDADVVVFSPEHFRIDVEGDYAFCREVWFEQSLCGQLTGSHRVNNAVAVFDQDNDFLDFYVHACQEIVRHATHLNTTTVGTRFLTPLHQLVPLPLINQVGMFSPVVLHWLARGQVATTLRLYQQTSGFAIHAANVCSSFRNTLCDGVAMTDLYYGQVIESLLSASPEAVRGPASFS